MNTLIRLMHICGDCSPARLLDAAAAVASSPSAATPPSLLVAEEEEQASNSCRGFDVSLLRSVLPRNAYVIRCSWEQSRTDLCRRPDTTWARLYERQQECGVCEGVGRVPALRKWMMRYYCCCRAEQFHATAKKEPGSTARTINKSLQRTTGQHRGGVHQ